MNEIKKIILLFIISFSFTNNVNIEFGSNSTISIPLYLGYDISENLSVNHINRFYHIDHPSWRYLYQKNERNNLTMISESSYFLYKKENINFKIGRDYIEPNSGKLNDLLFSSFSPSQNHILFNFSNENINGDMAIIKLDNRSIVCEDDESDDYCNDLNYGKHYINRWFYYRHISWNITDKLKIGFTDAIISTGEDRGIEFYYLMPLGSFQAEQLHNISRKDFIEEGEGYGINNDNGLLGFDFTYNINDKSNIYSSLLIDDFQIDAEDRKSMQDVFAFMIGYDGRFNNVDFIIEYGYASPWMYINSGLYSNLEYNYLPLGIRNPHSQFIDLQLDISFDSTSLTFFFHKEQTGDQTLYTDWDAWENKIGYFDFSKMHDIELFIKYKINKEYFPDIALYYNWKQSNSIDLLFMWDYTFN